MRPPWGSPPHVPPAAGQNLQANPLYLMGRVILDDGGLPDPSADIVTDCNGQVYVAAHTDKSGLFNIPSRRQRRPHVSERQRSLPGRRVRTAFGLSGVDAGELHADKLDQRFHTAIAVHSHATAVRRLDWVRRPGRRRRPRPHALRSAIQAPRLPVREHQPGWP